MSAANGTAVPQDATEATGKGKGKAVDTFAGRDMSMEDDEDSSEEESGVEDHGEHAGLTDAAEEVDEDNMEEIDQSNIIGGRTRGKQIDWAKAAEKSKEEGDEVDEDEDDDEDFEEPEDEDKMEE